MWNFAGLFESSARRFKRPLPGKWPDDASDGYSEVSVQEDAILGNGTWFFNMVISFTLAMFTAIQNVYGWLMVRLGFGVCAKCDDLRHTLELAYDHLRFARKTCTNLDYANTEIKKDSRLTRQLVQAVYRKLLGMADQADNLEKGVADAGDKLPRPGHQEFINLHGEMNEMRMLIRDLEEENGLLKVPMDKKDFRDRQRRLEKKRSILRRRLCIADARNEELLQENGKMARKLEKLKREPEVEEALKTAKEDVEWYEARTIRDQDSLREANRLLGLSQSDLREAQKAHRLEVERLQKEYDAKTEALEQDQRQTVAEMKQRVNSHFAEQNKEFEEREKTAVARAVARMLHQYDIGEAERVQESVDLRLAELTSQIRSQVRQKEKEWRREMMQVYQENTDLLERLRNQGKSSSTQAVEDVPKYLPFNNSPDKSKLVQELRGKIADLEAKRQTEQQEYQERTQAAVAEQWQMSGDEKGQEVPKEHTRLWEALLHAYRERDNLVEERDNLMQVWDLLPQAQADLDKAQKEVVELDEFAADKAEEAKQQKKDIAELKEKLEGLQKAHDSAVASRKAVLEANTKLQSDLLMTRNQVDTLVEQVEELEDDKWDLKKARDDADRQHALLLEAEKQKTREAVAAANTARNASHRTSIRGEEVVRDEGNVREPVSQQVSRRGRPARASVGSRSGSISARQRLPRHSQPIMAASPFGAAGSLSICRSERPALQQGEGRLNRMHDVANPSQEQTADSRTCKRRPSTPHRPPTPHNVISESSRRRFSAGADEDVSTFGVGRYCAIRTRWDSEESD